MSAFICFAAAPTRNRGARCSLKPPTVSRGVAFAQRPQKPLGLRARTPPPLPLLSFPPPLKAKKIRQRGRSWESKRGGEMRTQVARGRMMVEEGECRAPNPGAQAKSRGPRYVSELKDEMRALGISWRTVEAAKKHVGLISRRVGGTAGGWVWELPT